MKREGTINYEGPLELADAKPGTPVSFWRLAFNPFTRWKYGCVLHRYNAADTVAWYDKDGVPQSTHYRLRNAKRQSTWLVNKTKFWFRAEAETAASSAGLDKPQPITEIVTDIDGRVVSRIEVKAA